MHDLFDRIERVEKPVILAAQGPCLGGALELALSCDFRIAADVASFGFPELKLAVLPGSGGISRTTRLVGPAWARWLVLAGQAVDAATAHRIGLVHAVVPAAELEVTVERLAASLCDVVERGSGRDVERSRSLVPARYWPGVRRDRRRSTPRPCAGTPRSSAMRRARRPVPVP